MGSSRINFPLLLSALLISFATLSPKSHAADTLKAGQTLRDGETLISAGEIFELGFFCPGSSKNRYVGIWYHNFSTNTVLWIANRETPVPDTSGALAIGADGNLVVLDGSKRVIWSSSTAPLTSNESTAQLLDSGNLMLNNSGSVAWQSFDHPTDTYMPGMKVGLNMRTNVNQHMTSWKSEDDPAAGNFSLLMDPRRSTQIFMWEGTKPRWRSGRWNGQVFIGIQNMVPTYLYGFRLNNFLQEESMYFYYTAFNSSHRYVITWDGILKHLIWRNDTSVWYQFWAQPVTECELYNKCGNYGTCTDGNRPICACLEGFKPAVEDEWNSGNWTNGCIRRTPLQCDRNNKNGSVGADGFWKMEGVKLPDLSDWYPGVQDLKGCAATCLGNCSCKAHAYVSGIGCLIWGEDLVDIQMFSSGGDDMYLRLAAPELKEKKKKKIEAVVILAIALPVAFSIGCICLMWRCKRKLRAYFKLRPQNQEDGSVNRSKDRRVKIEISGAVEVQDEGKDGKLQELPLISFDSIISATGNFSHMNLLGEGGFGPVYKGTLPRGQEIAVKRLSKGSGQGHEEFKNEVMLIAKLQHRNLVRLLGYCIQGEEKILIYEYMPNRSLDAFLFGKKGSLNWKTRYNIIEGIARGLLYLHRDSRLRVIHRDLKASNILLDEDMNPKISDFGMARIFGRDDNETSTKKVVGTYGYMSPEYAMHGVFSVKSDVYSFGVLLLEIVSGKKNLTYRHPELGLNLIAYAWKSWNEDNVKEFVDPSVRDSCSSREALRCVNLGLLCVQDRANDRPTMSSLVIMLESRSAAYPQPRQPTFAAQMNSSETESSTSDLGVPSANNSITMVTAR